LGLVALFANDLRRRYGLSTVRVTSLERPHRNRQLPLNVGEASFVTLDSEPCGQPTNALQFSNILASIGLGLAGKARCGAALIDPHQL
jgi:hypothetical protein